MSANPVYLEKSLARASGDLLRFVGAGLTIGLNILMIETFSLTRIAWYLVPVAMLMLLAVGQAAVLGPARRASAVPPAVATRTV